MKIILLSNTLSGRNFLNLPDLLNSVLDYIILKKFNLKKNEAWKSLNSDGFQVHGCFGLYFITSVNA